MTDQTTVSGSDAGRQDEQPQGHLAVSTTQAVQGLDAAGPRPAVTDAMVEAGALVLCGEEAFKDASNAEWGRDCARTVLTAAAGVQAGAREQREHLWNEARKLIDKAISTAYRDPAGTTGDDCAVQTSNARIEALDFVRDAIRAGVPESRRPLGCALAMRVLQSDMYRTLDDTERAECDELVRQNLDWFKATGATT